MMFDMVFIFVIISSVHLLHIFISHFNFLFCMFSCRITLLVSFSPVLSLFQCSF